MIAAHLEPAGLSPDARPIANFMAMASMRGDAERGSEKLRRAIARAFPPKRVRKPRSYRHYGTFEERSLARSQIGRLQRVVAAYYGINADVFTQAERGPRHISEKRQVAMYLARHVIQSSFPDIAKSFGRKDHTTVIHACRVVAENPVLKADADVLRSKVRS